VRRGHEPGVMVLGAADAAPVGHPAREAGKPPAARPALLLEYKRGEEVLAVGDACPDQYRCCQALGLPPVGEKLRARLLAPAGGGEFPTWRQAKLLACGLVRAALGQLHELDRCESAEQGRTEAGQILEVRVIPVGREEQRDVLGAEAIVTYRHLIAVLPSSSRIWGAIAARSPTEQWGRRPGGAPPRSSAV
jgi:hypothetical protein